MGRKVVDAALHILTGHPIPCRTRGPPTSTCRRHETHRTEHKHGRVSVHRGPSFLTPWPGSHRLRWPLSCHGSAPPIAVHHEGQHHESFFALLCITKATVREPVVKNALGKLHLEVVIQEDDLDAVRLLASMQDEPPPVLRYLKSTLGREPAFQDPERLQHGGLANASIVAPPARSVVISVSERSGEAERHYVTGCTTVNDARRFARC